MTVYARSDIASVFIPAEGFGGCGVRHGRPVHEGAPVKVWQLDCLACENQLRRDPHWSSTHAEIPETYDQTLIRERDEKMGKLDRENQLAAALIELGKLGNLPQALAQAFAPALSAAGATVAGAEMLCPSGHPNAPGQKFCGECGASMHGPAPERQIEPPAPPQVPSVPSEDLVSLHPQKLAKKCREAGLNDKGSKAELVARLQAHARQAAGGGQ